MVSMRSARKLIEEAKSFRGGSIDGKYLDSRLAKMLDAVLKYGTQDPRKDS